MLPGNTTESSFTQRHTILDTELEAESFMLQTIRSGKPRSAAHSTECAPQDIAPSSLSYRTRRSERGPEGQKKATE